MNQSNAVDARMLWADLAAVREQTPLVHSITNLVVMNFTANALLAVGASPIMAHAHEEVTDIVAISQAVVLNIGTLEPAWVEAMRLTHRAARTRNLPVVLDPVGAGATPYRNAALASLLKDGAPTIVRGNASEVMSLAGLAAVTRGVDSSATSGEAFGAAASLARNLGAVVCVSGADDLVVDAGGRTVTLSNGHAWMTRITGVGCSASALVGAFAAVQPDPWRATVSAMAVLGVVGELAVERTRASGGGLGQLQAVLLDGLHLLDEQSFLSRVRMNSHA